MRAKVEGMRVSRGEFVIAPSEDTEHCSVRNVQTEAPSDLDQGGYHVRLV